MYVLAMQRVLFILAGHTAKTLQQQEDAVWVPMPDSK